MDESQQPITKKDLSISAGKATILSFAFGLPVACLLLAIYFWRWGAAQYFNSASPQLFLYSFIGVIATLIIGSVVHELIHGLSWSFFAHVPLKAIEFGFQWQALTPYVHYPEPMDVSAYRLGESMPLIILGLLPSVIGIITGNGWSIFFGFLFTLAASGDMLVLWLIRCVRRGQLVQDHPTRVGCYLIEKVE
jgi:Putative zincin peptidase